MTSGAMTTSVAIIGFSPFGQNLAQALSEASARVLVFDQDVAKVERLVPSARCTQVDATDEVALRRAGISSFPTVIVADCSDFEHNVMVTAALSDAGVPRIICQVSSRKHAAVLRRVGAHHIVEPHAEAARRLAKVLTEKL